MIKKNKITPTMREVAAKAGVSVATVSRALNRSGYIDSATRQRVEQAAIDLAYIPHAGARSLKLERTNTIGLVIADITNPFYSFLADGVLECASKLGYHVILCAMGEDPSLEKDAINVLIENRVDGIIAVPTGENLTLWQDALKLGIKLVMCDREIAGLGSDTVLVDNQKGSRDAIEMLIQLGHRRIGIICGPTSITTGKDRLEGYYQSLSKANIPVDQDLVQIGEFKRGAGFSSAHGLFNLDNPPTAIFATNNIIGEAVLFVIHERGLKIPEDISLVLFDDVPWASLTSPKVTVVAQPIHSLGFVSMEKLGRRLQESNATIHQPTRTVLQPKLVLRESCAPPKTISLTR